MTSALTALLFSCQRSTPVRSGQKQHNPTPSAGPHTGARCDDSCGSRWVSVSTCGDIRLPHIGHANAPAADLAVASGRLLGPRLPLRNLSALHGFPHRVLVAFLRPARYTPLRDMHKIVGAAVILLANGPHECVTTGLAGHRTITQLGIIWFSEHQHTAGLIH